MDHEFDRAYWDEHWRQVPGSSPAHPGSPPNPHLVREVGGLVPGTALEAGCGEGAEAIWLARAGWRVTAADIAEEALARAADRAAAQGVDGRVRWVRADLSSWQPEEPFDLVTTHYAHPTLPQLEFYDRLCGWVAPGGSILIVGHALAETGTHQAAAGHGHAQDHGGAQDHGHGHGHGHGHDHGPPAEASVTPESITARLDPGTWQVVTAQARTRLLEVPGSAPRTLDDVVVRAVRKRAGTTGD